MVAVSTTELSHAAYLGCLSNLENLNAHFIHEGMAQKDRLMKLNAIAIQSMKLLVADYRVSKLEDGK